MSRLSYKVYRFASGLRHKLPRRFTRAGLLAMGGVAVAGSAGADMDRTVAYQAFALMACLLVASLIIKRRPKGRFTLERDLPRLGTVGHPLRYAVRMSLDGRESQPSETLDVFEDLPDPRPSYEEFVAVRQSAVTGNTWRDRLKPRAFESHDFRPAIIPPARAQLPAKGSRCRFEFELLPLKRGVLRLEGLTLGRPDPLGLARALQKIPAPASITILPRRYPIPSLSLPGSRQYQPGGVALAAAIGETGEFVALRDYRPGDPLRHIHWRSWARTGRPIVREYQDEYVPRHALVLDTFASAAQDRAFEEAVSIAASFACTIDTQESLLDLLFVGPQAICFTTGRAVGQPTQALEILAAVQRQAPGPGFAALRTLVLQHAPLVGHCLCVFVDWDEPRRDLVAALQAQGLPVLAMVVNDPRRPVNRRPPPRLDGVHFLEAGRIAEGLAALEESA